MVSRLLDTSVLVDHLRGRDTLSALGITLDTARDSGLHPVCAAELVEGARDTRSLTQVRRLIGSFTTVECSSDDIAASLEMLSSHRLAHGVDWHDCLIAATALRLRVPVFTLNVKHFRCFKRLKLERLD